MCFITKRGNIWRKCGHTGRGKNKILYFKRSDDAAETDSGNSKAHSCHPQDLKLGPPGPLKKGKIKVSGVKWVIGIVL